MQPGVRIDYKALRKINPEAARQAVLEYLASSSHNIAATARGTKVGRWRKEACSGPTLLGRWTIPRT